MSANQTMTTWQIADGMTVYGTGGDKLGTLRNYAPQLGYLDIQKGWLFHKDFYVPLAAVEVVDEDGICLRLSKDDLDSDLYTTRPMAGAVMSGEAFVTTTPPLPEEKVPLDAEHTERTVTRVVASEPVH